MTVYIITNIYENGINCVMGAFKSEDKAFDYLNSIRDEDQTEYVTKDDLLAFGYIIHQKELKI